MPSKLHPRRLLPRLGLILLLFLALTITLGVGLTEDPPPLPESSLQIQLPDGQMETLGSILEAGLAQDERLLPMEDSGTTTSNADDTQDPEPAVTIDPADLALRRGRSWLLSPNDRDPYRLGRELASRGDVESAIALLRSVPKEHPEFARSQRFVGWDLYTCELNQPRVGMHFIRQSIREDPMSGNAWQDGYRVLGRTILPESMAKLID